MNWFIFVFLVRCLPGLAIFLLRDEGLGLGLGLFLSFLGGRDFDICERLVWTSKVPPGVVI